MSLKNRDNHNRWRNKTVAFRVSPEEDAQIETFVKLPSAFTLFARFPAALREPLGASVTLWEATAPVKLPA